MNWQFFLGVSGWVLLLLSWVVQRPIVQNKLNCIDAPRILNLFSFNNTNNVSHNGNQKIDIKETPKNDSKLESIANFATIIGLGLTAYPLFFAK